MFTEANYCGYYVPPSKLQSAQKHHGGFQKLAGKSINVTCSVF